VRLSSRAEESELEAENQPAASRVRDIVNARRHARFKLEVNIGVHSRTCGMLEGRTVDLSESGISAMLRLEVPLGEVVKLDFELPLGPVTIHAVVRQRNAFRYGFQFLESSAANEIIRSTCHQLAVEQSG
jgi:PilZ domain